MEIQARLEDLFNLFDLRPGASIEALRGAYLNKTFQKKFERVILHQEPLRNEFQRYHETYIRLMKMMHDIDDKQDYSYRTKEELYRFIFNQGVYALCRENYIQASARLHEVFKIAPKERLLLIYMGILLSRRRQYNSAEKYLREALQLDREDEDAWFFLGDNYCRAKRYKKAVECFEKAQKLEPAHTEIAFLLKDCREKLAKMDEKEKRPTLLRKLVRYVRDAMED
jgi:tetratricopeptide (TPR) repeat protein